MSGRAAPPASGARLAALVLEGYLYILLVIGVFLATLAFIGWGVVTRRPLVALVGFLIGLPVVRAVTAAVRALAVPPVVMDGLEVSPAEAPALHAMVDEVRRRIRSPHVRRIVVGPAVNATAMQHPRLLLFRPRNDLHLGLPLLVSLTSDQLRAVVAHEMGHFSRAHGRFTAWVYRTRMSWLRMVHALHTRGTAPMFVYWLARRYVPRLDAMSLSVARQQEFLADRCAADAVGTRVAADALVAIELLSRFHDEVFWPALRDRLEGDPESVRPYRAIAAELRGWNPGPSGWLEEALARGPQPDGTHPSLVERLQALGEAPRVPPPAGDRAGDVYLGDRLPGLAARLDEDWVARYGDAWRSRSADLLAARERLAELRALADRSVAERVEEGKLVERLEGSTAAEPLYRSAHLAGSAAAGLELGRLLLDRGDEEGVAVVEAAMQADDTLVVAGCDLLIPFHLSRGRLHDAERCRTRASRHAMQRRLAAEERDAVTPVDRLVPHGLAERELAGVREGLSRRPEVSGAWLARREFRHGQGGEFLLGVVLRSRAESTDLDGVAGALPGAARLLRLEAAHPDVRRRMQAMPGACVYP
ncbi:MAG TPA: M48 family metalloprotease [Gemmatimonadales bacterium]|nr:M48 family metalloprotease [Gemmatimonadales bacterium]